MTRVVKGFLEPPAKAFDRGCHEFPLSIHLSMRRNSPLGLFPFDIFHRHHTPTIPASRPWLRSSFHLSMCLSNSSSLTQTPRFQRAVKSGCAHVLGYGYRPDSAHGGNGSVRTMHGVENAFPNTIISYLKTWIPFRELHNLVRNIQVPSLQIQNCAIFHTLKMRFLLMSIRSRKPGNTSGICIIWQNTL